jgi:sialate O-acetylesterase
MISFRRLSLLAATFVLTFTASLRATVALPKIFGDHMVLQEGMSLPVWGMSDPGEEVTVTVGTESGRATADASGKWRVNLAALPATATPVTLTVAGKSNTLTFSDVLVGEVWICSGQSNMEFNLGGAKFGLFGGAHDADTVLPTANDPQLRLFIVAKKTSLDPLDDVKGRWQLCTPDSAMRFSAVGYFFGRDLRQDLNKPVGLIGTYWVGSPAQAWTSLSALQKEPVLKHYVDAEEASRAGFAQATVDYPAKLAAFQIEIAAWQKNVKPSADAAMAKWKETAATMAAAGQTAPPPPVPSAPMPRAPAPPDGGSRAPIVLFNGMIAPLIPFAFKGAIWYQGEGNSWLGLEYRTLFRTLINDWREKWGEGVFPFLFVQLAGCSGGKDPTWPYLREAQLMTLSLPNTGMATAIDIGNPSDIHPKDKHDVGHRLALVARHVAYGENLVFSGPIYSAMKVDGNAIDLTFTNMGSGLIIGKAPWVADGFKPLPDDKLSGFIITGADKNWVPAQAKIVGDTVVALSTRVASPVAVRYDWSDAPQGNLYNKENLAASSFRTDDWSERGAGVLSPVVAK